MKRIRIFGLLYCLIFCLNCGTQDKNQLFERDQLQLVEECRLMVESDQKHRSNPNLSETSFAELQIPIDVKNTKRLIEITKKYGYPNTIRLGEPIGVFIVFHHAPEEFHAEILPLIIKENKEGRLPKNELELIKWHLGGRVGFPILEGVEIIDKREAE